MFTEYFGLTSAPFRLTPDARFFFGSNSHWKALAHITFGLSQGDGFVVITGNVGAGKTTLLEHLWSQLSSSEYIAAKILTTQLSPIEFLRVIVSAFGLGKVRRDKASMLAVLAEFFRENHKAGKRILLIIDEAQNLPFRTLEELRMLANLAIGYGAPLATFLLGQPQFRTILASRDAEQLRQRVFTCYHLGALDAAEVKAYVEHRLRIASWSGDPSFADDAFATIYRHTNGVPRMINLLCSRVLLSAFLDERHAITAANVETVAAEWANELGSITAPSSAATPSPGNPSALQRIQSLEHQLARQDTLLKQSLEALLRLAEQHQ